MSDELEPVEQQFIADFARYAQPMEDAADETEGFADVVRQAEDAVRSLKDQAAEAGEAIAGLGGAEDDGTGSAEAFAEAQHEVRDSLIETDHELHDQTESYFALAAAETEAAAASAAFHDAMGRESGDADGLYGSLRQLRDLLADSAVGDVLGIGNAGGGRFAITNGIEDETKSVGYLGDAMRDVDAHFEDADRAARSLGLSLRDTENIGQEARRMFENMGFSEIHAAAGARELEKAQRDLSSLIGGGGGSSGGFLSVLANLFGHGGESALGNAAGFASGALLIAPALVAAVQEIGLLITGFIAAGGGIASFAALAIPEFDKIKNAYEGIHQAQAAYHAAVQLEAKDPTKANAEAEATALAKLKIAYENMSPATRDAVRGIDQLKDSYERMAKAFAPDALRVFNLGLKGLNEFLPTIKPFADTASTAIDGLLKKLDKFLSPTQPGLSKPGVMGAMPQPSPFTQWLDAFDKISGPAITAIGQGIGQVAVDFGKLMTALPPQDVVNAIRIAFDLLGGGIKFAAWAAKHTAKDWDETVSLIRTLKHAFDNVSHAYGNFSHAMDNVSHALDNVGHAADNVRHFFDKMNDDIRRVWQDIQNWIGDGVSWVRSHIDSAMSWVESHWDSGWSHVVAFAHRVPGMILSALGDLGNLLVGEGERLISGLISGIENRIPGLESAVHLVEGLLHDIGIGGGGGGNITGGVGRAALGAGGGGGGGGSITINHKVDLGGAVVAPAHAQLLQRAVQAAVLDYAQANPGAMMTIPGRRAS